MALTNPRIIVVDAGQSLFNIVRAAMELMGKRPRLIETSTGDDAMAELQISSPDLLVTAQTLLGNMDGVTLAITAKRELAALPVILLGNENDPELGDDLGSVQYVRRPLAPETLLRALRVALDGPEAAPRETGAEETMLPVPPIDHDRLNEVMFRLMRDVGAMAIVLSDRNGKVLAYDGAAGYFDRDALSAALAPGFGDALKLLPLIGDHPRALKYYDGERGTLFGLALGLHHHLTLVFDGNAPASALGNVKRYGFAAINEMLESIGAVAFETRPIIQAPARSAEASGKRRTRHTQETKAVGAAGARTKATAKEAPAAEPAPKAANLDPSLFEQLDNLDLSEADSLFDPQQLGRPLPGAGDNRISFDDALLQGIIGDIEE